jgi:hypothetical protein
MAARKNLAHAGPQKLDRSPALIDRESRLEIAATSQIRATKPAVGS